MKVTTCQWVSAAMVGVGVLSAGCSQQASTVPDQAGTAKEAAAPAGPPAGYKVYGAPMEARGEAVTASAATATPDAYDGKAVRLAGTIDAVCENRGCWLSLREGGKIVRARFVESGACTNGFFVPRDAAGHKVILQGTFKKERITEARARHFLEEGGASQEEIEKIKGPQDVLSIVCTSVAIEGGDTLSAPVQPQAAGG